MALGLERLDLLQGEEAERPVGAAVELPVAVTVALEAGQRDAGGPDGALRHAAGRDVDPNDAPGHPISGQVSDQSKTKTPLPVVWVSKSR